MKMFRYFVAITMIFTGCASTESGVYKDGVEVPGWSDTYKELIRRNYAEEVNHQRLTEQNCDK